MSEVETLPPEDFLGPRRFKVTCLCKRCGKKYSYVAPRLSDPDRPCPKKACKAAAHEEEIQRAARNLVQILSQQKAPGHIGGNVTIKAVDETAAIVMKDYGFTDLKDNIREGESVAPSLPPQQQKLADGYFGGKAVAERWGANNRAMQVLGARAMAGAFRGMAMNPGTAVPGKRGEKPLWPVRTEVINSERRR
jgi:hypothetical protein